MTLNQQKELLSLAYIRAVAAAACCKEWSAHIDDESVDVKLGTSRPGCLYIDPEVNIQVKATSQVECVHQDTIAFPLKLKNYNDLRATNLSTPKILVVMVLPHDEPDRWVTPREFKTTLYRCAYWVSLHGMPETQNSATVTVPIRRSNVFSPSVLSSIMSTIANGGTP